MRYAYDKYSPDWIWIMEADAYPDGDCLNYLISMRSVIYSASHVSSSNTFEYYKKPTVIGNNV